MIELFVQKFPFAVANDNAEIPTEAIKVRSNRFTIATAQEWSIPIILLDLGRCPHSKAERRATYKCGGEMKQR